MTNWLNKSTAKPNRKSYSLYLGLGGEILFRYICSINNASENKNTNKLILKIIHQLGNESSIECSICSGITGTIWLLNYLQNKKFIILSNDFFDEIDQYIFDISLLQLHENNIDFMHGAMGNMYVLLDRKKNHPTVSKLLTSFFKNRNSYEGINTFLYRYESPDNKLQTNSISLGLSHGLPSIMYFLSKCYDLNIKKKACFEIIQNQYTLLKMHRNLIITKTNFSFYPCFISEDLKNKFSSRMAWCYGDLGIAASLYYSGKMLKNQEMLNEAIEIIDYYSNKKHDKDSGVIDAGLCHGSSGVALIFYCFYWQTKNELYLNRADYWIKITLQYLEKSNDIQSNLLEGIYGMASIIETIQNRKNPDWASIFLLF